MPQVKYTKTKGLHQVTGNGVRGLLRKQVIPLTDAGTGTAIRSAITEEESGAIFLVPAVTGGNQTITLPALTDSLVGCYWEFLAVGDGNASHTFLVKTAETDTHFFAVAIPDGDGTNTMDAEADNVGFSANYDAGAKFRVTCVSSTAAMAFHAEFLANGLASGVEFASS